MSVSHASFVIVAMYYNGDGGGGGDGDSYQNLEYQSCGVTFKVEWWKYGMAGVTGMAGAYYAGAYYAGARMWPQLIVPLLKNWGVLNFGLRVENSGGRRICRDMKVIGLCFS